jgi:hypothetical protein
MKQPVAEVNRSCRRKAEGSDSQLHPMTGSDIRGAECTGVYPDAVHLTQFHNKACCLCTVIYTHRLIYAYENWLPHNNGSKSRPEVWGKTTWYSVEYRVLWVWRDAVSGGWCAWRQRNSHIKLLSAEWELRWNYAQRQWRLVHDVTLVLAGSVQSGCNFNASHCDVS